MSHTHSDILKIQKDSNHLYWSTCQTPLHPVQQCKRYLGLKKSVNLYEDLIAKSVNFF